MRVLALVLVWFAAGWVWSAVACATEIDWTGPDVTNDPRVAWSLDVATGYWGGEPPWCPDGVTITTFDDPDPLLWGRGQLGGCRIWLDRTFMNAGRVPIRQLCALVTHELGHNWGHGHSDRAGDVMHATVEDGPPRCGDWRKEHPRRPYHRRFR